VAGVARRRLDAELVRRKLARSREHAGQLIAAGRVSVGKTVATKPATQVETAAAIVVAADENDPDYVSRGGHKLAGALTAFLPQGLVVEGRRALDAGASTGGFTQVLLERGCRRVYAVDVGTDQLAPALRQDPRVVVHEQTNLRDLALHHLDGQPVDLTVADVSFISLTLLVGRLAALTSPAGRLLLMVKPQFEVGRERLGRGGVVRSPELHAEAVHAVAGAAADAGWYAHAVRASRLPGPAGNREFFLLLGAVPPARSVDVEAAVAPAG
jgi:23S rRNA (cytidine1920-2'-O)/16S rRNA (cytidine1409-2'-O)-methyltransferase